MNNAIEALGYLVALIFLWVVWAPAALLGLAILLVIFANVRAARARRGPESDSAARQLARDVIALAVERWRVSEARRAGATGPRRVA